VDVSLGKYFDVIVVSTKALKHMEFDRLKCTHVIQSKSGNSLMDAADDEA
jgi:hypothetical protein